MEIRFYIHPATGQPHIYDHGVTEEEVEFVLLTSSDDRLGRDDSRICVGQTAGGRYLRVIYVPDEIGDGLFVITAYPLAGKQRAAYRRRRKNS
ncbi:MAG: DUF4258 domain-containing protein [Planctomycetota bacterium]